MSACGSGQVFVAESNSDHEEAWGEDKVLTSHMGIAYSSGLSKNGSLSEPDAVVPIIKVCRCEARLYSFK